jgi:formyltetrahydrofolate hydrolase
MVLVTSTAIASVGGNIVENERFTDPVTSQFCLRTRFEAVSEDLDALRDIIVLIFAPFEPDLTIRR